MLAWMGLLMKAAGSPDHLAGQDVFPHGDHRLGGRAGVLGQGNDGRFGRREAYQRQVGRELLALEGVDAAIVTLKTLFTDGLDVLADGLVVDFGPVSQLHALGLKFVPRPWAASRRWIFSQAQSLLLSTSHLPFLAPPHWPLSRLLEQSTMGQMPPVRLR